MIGSRYPPSEGRMVQCRPAFSVANSYVCPGPFSLGNSVGANGWSVGSSGGFGPGGLPGWASGFGSSPSLVTILITPLRGWGVTRRGAERLSDRTLKIVTWLILPVVICLSQRLSHACLSISNLYGETANGSLNQLSFI